MRTVFSIIGGVAGAVAGLLYLGNYAGEIVLGMSNIESPDQGDNIHAFAFLGATIAAIVAGWLLGLGIGSLFRRKSPQT